MNISGLGAASSIIHNMQQAEVRVWTDVAPPAATSSGSQAAESDTVSISDEGKKKLSTELGIAMHKNVASSEVQESDKVDTRTDTEKKIDKLKEEIKELQEQRQALANDHSEAAEEKRKNIDAQIIMLNVQITVLLKAQKDEAEAAS